MNNIFIIYNVYLFDWTSKLTAKFVDIGEVLSACVGRG